MAKKKINEERSEVMNSATKDIETAIAEAMKKYGLSDKECMLTCAMAILHVHNETEQTNKATSLKLDIDTPDGIYKTKAVAKNGEETKKD